LVPNPDEKGGREQRAIYSRRKLARQERVAAAREYAATGDSDSRRHPRAPLPP
jgi:hypothetical protein